MVESEDDVPFPDPSADLPANDGVETGCSGPVQPDSGPVQGSVRLLGTKKSPKDWAIALVSACRTQMEWPPPVTRNNELDLISVALGCWGSMQGRGQKKPW
jgi:hypothetical protein